MSNNNQTIVSSGDAVGNSRQPVFVNPIVPAGFTGAVLGPSIVRGLTPFSDYVSRDVEASRFVVPEDALNPLSSQRAAQLAWAANDANLAGTPTAAAGTGSTDGGRSADSVAAIAAVTPAPVTKGAAEATEDCADKPMAKPKVKPKIKIAASNPFVARAGEGSRSFSEQVGEARKAFKPPVKVQRVVARDC